MGLFGLGWFHARCKQSRARATVGVEDSASSREPHRGRHGPTASRFTTRRALLFLIISAVVHAPLDSLQFPISPPEPAGDQHASFLSRSYRSALGLHRSVLSNFATRLRRPRSTSVVCSARRHPFCCSQPGGNLVADTPPPPSCPNLRRDARLCQPQKRRHHHLSCARRADSDALSFHFTPWTTSILASRALKSCTTDYR